MDAIKSSLKKVRQKVRTEVFISTGVYKVEDDSDFQAEVAEWRATVNALRSVQQSFKKNQEGIKACYSSSAALAVELAAFHRNTSGYDQARNLVTVFAAVDAVNLVAAHRLYEENAMAAINLQLWQVPEVETKIAERKKLMKEYVMHRHKFEAAEKAQAQAQNQNFNGGGGGIMRKEKSDGELMADMETKRMRLEQAQRILDDITEWCRTQFDALLEARENGSLLAGPMTSFFVLQKRLTETSAARLDQIKKLFPSAEPITQQLAGYEAEVKDDDANIFPDTSPQNLDMNGCFGVALDQQVQQQGGVPRLVVDAVRFLTHDEANLETEGLFNQVSGNAYVLQSLQSKYNSNDDVELSTYGCDAHDVATLLKTYLRELPQSLIPQFLYDDMIQAAREANASDAIADNVMPNVPEEHLLVLSKVLLLLNSVARREKRNKMSVKKLATALGPQILRAPEDVSPTRVMQDMPYVISAMEILIKEAKRYDIAG